MKQLYEYLMSKQSNLKFNDFEANHHLAKIYEYVTVANLDSKVLVQYEEALSKMFELSKENIYVNDLLDLFAYIVESGQYRINRLSGNGPTDMKTILFTYDKAMKRVVVLIRNIKSNTQIKVFLNEKEYGAKLYIGNNHQDYYAYSWRVSTDYNKPFFISYNDKTIERLGELIRKELFQH